MVEDTGIPAIPDRFGGWLAAAFTGDHSSVARSPCRPTSDSGSRSGDFTRDSSQAWWGLFQGCYGLCQGSAEAPSYANQWLTDLSQGLCPATSSNSFQITFPSS